MSFRSPGFLPAFPLVCLLLGGLAFGQDAAEPLDPPAEPTETSPDDGTEAPPMTPEPMTPAEPETAEPADGTEPSGGETDSAPESSGTAPSEAKEVENLWLMPLIWGLALAASIAALIQAYLFYANMMEADEGNEKMIEIAEAVREGANAYLYQQYMVVGGFFVVIVILLALAAFVFDAQSRFVPFAFLTGGFFSGLAGWFGMRTATQASSRTAAGAEKNLNQGLQVAFRSGAVMGLTVVGLGLLDITLWFAFLYWVWPMLGQEPLSLEIITVTMLCFGMGASAQALFARVGGGIFTKAADVGADLVGKVEQGIPEDDPRNPATIADNVGDNVGDVAGMGADLYESYCGSILATAALGVAAFSSGDLNAGGLGILDAQLQAMFLPLAIAAIGIALSIGGVYLVRAGDEANQGALLGALGLGINTAAGLVCVASVVLAILIMPQTEGTVFFGFLPGVAFSIIIGVAAGWLIGQWTEYSTSDEYQPTKDIAGQAETGPATVIIGGIAWGMRSTWAPVIIVAFATIGAFGFATGWEFNDMNYFALGLYGVGIAAVGMLSTLGITLATDAYGPIADNAGGNAEMAGLEPVVRERTDALDRLGNTTAATGKGFAIGSAALTALALLAAYVEEVRIGFERWGESVAEQYIETGDIKTDGFYKVSNQFVIRIQNFDAAKEAAEKNDFHAYAKDNLRGYLAMPDDLRDEKISEAWEKMEFTTPSPISAEGAGAMLQVEAGKRRDRVSFAESGASLVEVKAATLPQFTTYYDASLMNPKVLIGVFLGAMATFLFCALTMEAVGRAAQGMVEEVRRQFRENPGIMEGTVKPDYSNPVQISTRAAQMEMIAPSLLGLFLPVVVGIVLGVGGVMGLLVGTLACGFCVAIFMANAGGAWDNAKKYIEAGAHGGKGGDPHKAAVVGDTVGDPFKDTSGPSLNILIKLMSMVAVVTAGVIVRYSLLALGIF